MMCCNGFAAVAGSNGFTAAAGGVVTRLLASGSGNDAQF